jgi:RES domain-containing protein
MVAYRIGSRTHILFDGAGASASDNARWNSRGRSVIYAAEHYAAAVLEKAAQVNAVRLPASLAYIRIDIPTSASVELLAENALPGWADNDRTASQAFGDRWYDERRSVVLIVPSLVAPGIERNVLINQRHPQFAGLSATRPAPLVLHPRLRAGQR